MTKRDYAKSFTQMLVVTGNPNDGFRYFGPFVHGEEASNWAEVQLASVEWWMAPLLAPVTQSVADALPNPLPSIKDPAS